MREPSPFRAGGGQLKVVGYYYIVSNHPQHKPSHYTLHYLQELYKKATILTLMNCDKFKLYESIFCELIARMCSEYPKAGINKTPDQYGVWFQQAGIELYTLSKG